MVITGVFLTLVFPHFFKSLLDNAKNALFGVPAFVIGLARRLAKQQGDSLFNPGHRIHRKASLPCGLNNLAVVHVAHGDARAALKRYEEAIGIAKQIGAVRGQTIYLRNSAIVLRTLGQHDRAVAASQRALSLLEGRLMPMSLARSTSSLARSLLIAGQAERALEVARPLVAQTDADWQTDKPELVTAANLTAALAAVVVGEREFAREAAAAARAHRRPTKELNRIVLTPELGLAIVSALLDESPATFANLRAVGERRRDEDRSGTCPRHRGTAGWLLARSVLAAHGDEPVEPLVTDYGQLLDRSDLPGLLDYPAALIPTSWGPQRATLGDELRRLRDAGTA